MPDTPECPHVSITLLDDHLECSECHTHEVPLAISREDFTKLLRLISTIIETLERSDMTDTAALVREHAQRLIVNRELLWRP